MLHGVIIRLADLKDYEESERVAARIAAAFTMYIKKVMPLSMGIMRIIAQTARSEILRLLQVQSLMI